MPVLSFEKCREGVHKRIIACARNEPIAPRSVLIRENPRKSAKSAFKIWVSLFSAAANTKLGTRIRADLADFRGSLLDGHDSLHPSREELCYTLGKLLAPRNLPRAFPRSTGGQRNWSAPAARDSGSTGGQRNWSAPAARDSRSTATRAKRAWPVSRVLSSGDAL